MSPNKTRCPLRDKITLAEDHWLKQFLPKVIVCKPFRVWWFVCVGVGVVVVSFNLDSYSLRFTFWLSCSQHVYGVGLMEVREVGDYQISIIGCYLSEQVLAIFFSWLIAIPLLVLKGGCQSPWGCLGDEPDTWHLSVSWSFNWATKHDSSLLPITPVKSVKLTLCHQREGADLRCQGDTLFGSM